MTDEPTPSGGGGGRSGLKSLSILWAVLVGIGLVALGGSIPSAQHQARPRER